MKKEAIILAGGFGTRLQSVVKEQPKPLAPIQGKPFLDYLLQYLESYQINKVILAIGYKSDQIIERYKNGFNEIEIVFAEEKEALGTGGAIKNALFMAETENVLILNGDSIFKINLNQFFNSNTKNCPLMLALRKIKNASRYGQVEINSNNLVTAFKEKTIEEQSGLINAGIYLIQKTWLLAMNFPTKFSFETEVLMKLYPSENFMGIEFQAYFIDIGIPEDYAKAQNDFLHFEQL